MNILRKFLISIILGIFLFTSTLLPFFARGTNAQTAPQSWYNQKFPQWFDRVYGTGTSSSEVFGERYTAAQVQWVIYGLMAFIINQVGDPELFSCVMGHQNSFECADTFKKALHLASTEDPKSQYVVNNSLIETLIQDRPISAITYFKNIGRNLKIIPEANAQVQGFGFRALDPVIPLWRAARNTAYAFLVLAILVIAFMIMFRVKISPQIVISVQSALPKVITTLILITFSYAIAGLFVDLMYVVIGVFSLILNEAYRNSGFANLGIVGGLVTPGMMFSYMTTGPGGTGILGALFLYIFLFTLGLVVALFGAGGIVGVAVGGTLIAAAISTGVAQVIGPILLIIILIILFVLIFRILWMLLRAFAFVILLTAVAPIQLVLGLIVPSFGFSQWLKSFISNLAVFPVTGLFLSLSFLFLNLSINTIFENIFSGNPILAALRVVFGSAILPAGTPGWPPLMAGTNSLLGVIYLGVSFVLLTLLPRVTEIIRGIIEGRPYAYGTAIGEAFGPGAQYTGIATTELGGGNLPGPFPLLGYKRPIGTTTGDIARWIAAFGRSRKIWP